MSSRTLATLVVLALLTGCASTSNGGRTSATKDGDHTPMQLKHKEDEVPPAVKAIESLIDRKGALVADEITIECSRNYEWDVSLIGHDVSPLRPEGEGHVSEATGNARAQFRNLELRAYRKIRFFKSGFDVVPYIRILAEGHAAYVTLPDGASSPAVRRARTIRIENANLSLDGRPTDPAARPGATPAAFSAGPPRSLRQR